MWHLGKWNILSKFISIRIKKDEDQRKEKCHTKSMMSNEDNERLKRDTQDVPLRKSVEEKVRGMGLTAVWDDANEWSAEEGRKAEKKGRKVLKSA